LLLTDEHRDLRGLDGFVLYPVACGIGKGPRSRTFSVTAALAFAISEAFIEMLTA